MIRSVFLAVLFLVATLLAAPSGRAASYSLNDGQSVVGNPVSVNKDGVVFRIGEGQFSPRAGWTNFTQEALKELAKDAKAKVFAEQFIEKDEPDPELQAKKKALEIKKYLNSQPSSAFGQPAAQSENRRAAPVQVGKAYKVLVGMGALRFKILEIGKDGLVKVQAVEDGTFVGIKDGTTWWLNLNQALLVEAID